MNCQFQHVAQRADGRHDHRCTLCGHTRHSAWSDPRKVHAVCVAAPKAVRAPVLPLTESDVEARLAICRACPEGHYRDGFCAICPTCQSLKKENFERLVQSSLGRCPLKLWPAVELVDQALLAELTEPPRPRDPEWHLRPDVIGAHRKLLDQAVERARQHQSAGGVGRGIVTLGGTSKYFGSAWVLVSMLRQLGCTLPVEWFYLGPSECDEPMRSLAESLGGVTCTDLLPRLAQLGMSPRILAGWEAKVWAILASSFAEVLFLDADNVPAQDPTFLFDGPEYLAAGAVFWEDFPPEGWSVMRTAFEAARLPVPGNSRRPGWRNPTDYRPFETGQVVVDKTRHAAALLLLADLCDHSDFWFPGVAREASKPWHVYGDKDLFYLAWERLGASYAMPAARCTFCGGRQAGAFMQPDFAGEVLFQHRAQPACKWRLHGPNPEPAAKPGTPRFVHHELCLAALADLRGKWIGHPYDAADQAEGDRALAHACCGRKLWFRDGRDDCPGQGIELLASGRTDLAEYHWTVRHWAGQPQLILATFDRAVAFMGRDDKGNWVHHGTQDFLMDAPPADFNLPLDPSEVVIWHEVVRDNEYRLPERFRHGDVVIDIGGHCGMFAWACLSRGAGQVISVEPHPENFARLERNLRPFGDRSQRIQAAAWSEAGELHLTQPEWAKHTGGWTAVGVAAGVPAQAIPFDSLVTRGVRLVKLDCEGSEWEILRGCRTFDHIDAWCGEWHQRPFAEAAAELRSLLEPHGYAVTVERHPGVERLGHFWAVRRGGC